MPTVVSLLQTGTLLHTVEKIPGRAKHFPSQEQTDRKARIPGSPSSSALGCIGVRSYLHAQGLLPDAWTDVCFSSVTHNDVEPDEATVSQWMHAPCSCEVSLAAGSPSLASSILSDNKNGVVPFDRFAEIGIRVASRENQARALAIDTILHTLLAETPNAQVVNLGAGFDGRFFASHSMKNASALFEMDLPGTQALKKALVHNCNLESMSSGGVHFLPLDLSKDNVYEVLFNDSAFDATLPTLFISEAVFQYIPERQVLKSMKILADAMHKNDASRLILQSWTDEALASKVLDDKVLFGFPTTPSAREALWTKVGLTVDQSSASQSARRAFYQSLGSEMHFEYFDVLAPAGCLSAHRS